MKAPAQPGLLTVATRELRWMRRDPIALVLMVVVPVIAFAILTLTFSNAVIRNLHITIVDADRSPTSLIYVQAIASAPGVLVAERSDDMTSAMRAIRSGDAIAAVYIPENFERDILAGRRPQIVTLYNRQYFTPGNSAASAISSAVSAATATLPQEKPDTRYRPGALVAEQYVLSNPALNYAQFLLRAVLPTVLHVVVALSAGYAVGSEFSRRSKRAWLRAAGGRPLVALIGKLAPLFGVFIVMIAIVALILHGLYDAPFRGAPTMVAAGACLYIVAYLSLGAFLVLLTQNLASGMSLIAIFCNPAFGFAGVGFPIAAMNGFAKVWGSFLPLRWYLQILFDQAARGVPASDTVGAFGVLSGLACLFFALAWVRLRSVAFAPKRAEAAAPPRIQRGRGIAIAMGNEARRILADRSVFGLIVLAPLIYGALYPQPYLGQVLRNIPLAVVDHDHTELSRDLVQALNADEVDQGRGRGRHAGGRSGGSRPAAGFRDRRHSEGHRTSGPAGREGADRSLCRCGLFSRLQSHASGHFGGRGDDFDRHRAARRADERQPRARRRRRGFSGRLPLAAALQPDRRLRQLCRSRGFHPDRATDAASGLRFARRRGL